MTTSTANAEDLERLLACAPLREAFDRIVMVDNATTDGSREIALRGGAELVERRERGGYGTCINNGVPGTRGAFFALMNPDILLEDAAAIDRLARHFEDPRVAVVAPALRLPDGRIQDSVRHVPTPLDLVLRRLGSPERGAIRDGGDVPWAVAAFWLVRREAWQAMGGFDERYFLYFEDVDLCVRLRRAGWKVRHDPGVVVRHEFGAASRKALAAPATRHHIRSALRFFVHNPRHFVTRRIA